MGFFRAKSSQAKAQPKKQGSARAFNLVLSESGRLDFFSFFFFFSFKIWQRQQLATLKIEQQVAALIKAASYYLKIRQPPDVSFSIFSFFLIRPEPYRLARASLGTSQLGSARASSQLELSGQSKVDEPN